MEPVLPKYVRTVLLDGTTVPVLHNRGGKNPVRFPAPSFGRLVPTRGSVGTPVYGATTDFGITGPHLTSPDHTYNNLHDPHLRDYYNQPAQLKRLKKANFITEDNEVICTLQEYNAQELYLRDLKLFADRQFDELWEEKIELMADFQRKGLISEDVSIKEMIEYVLERRIKQIRDLLEKDKAKKRRAATDELEDEEEIAIEMALLTWKLEVRQRLAPFEKQFRHGRNREKHYEALQKERERKRDASEERRRAAYERRTWEKVEKSEALALKDRKMLPKHTVLDPLEEHSGSSQLSEGDTAQETAGLSGFFQRQAPAAEKILEDQEKSTERGDTSQEEEMYFDFAERQRGCVPQPNPAEPQVMVPQRPKTDAPAHRPHTARPCQLKPLQANQIQAPAPPQRANDPEMFPEKGSIPEKNIDGSTAKHQSGSIKQPTLPMPPILPPLTPKMDAPALRPRTDRPCQPQPVKANQIQAPAPPQTANDPGMFPEKGKTPEKNIDGSTAKHQSGSIKQPTLPMPPILLPLTPKMDAPALRPRTDRPCQPQPVKANQIQAPAPPQTANDPGMFPEKGKTPEKNIDGSTAKHQSGSIKQPTLPMPPILLPLTPKMDAPALRPRTDRPCQPQPVKANQMRAPAPPQTANDPGMFPEKGKTPEKESDGFTLDFKSGYINQPINAQPQVLLPLRPKMDAPELRPSTARPCRPQPVKANQELPPKTSKVVLPNERKSSLDRIYGPKSPDTKKKLPPLNLKGVKDVGWFPEKALVLWEREIQGFFEKVLIRKPQAPKVPQQKKPKVRKSAVERIYGLKSSDAYKNLPGQRKATPTTPSPPRYRG